MDIQLRKRILKALSVFLQQTEDSNLWVYCRYTGEWYSPERLNQLTNEDKLIRGIHEFEAKNPDERTQELKDKAEKAKKEADGFERKVREYREKRTSNRK